MPELPDVEAVRRYLVKSGIVGLKFTDVLVMWPNAIKTPSLEDFVLGILERSVCSIDRRAKFLIIRLDDGKNIVVHLRMTGSLVMRSPVEPRHRMTRNYFTMDDGRELLFVDPRKLGMLWLVEDENELVGMLGPEPLEPEFTADLLGQILSKKMAPVKALLCDQKLIAGIGNIYADEVLFTSNIHPLTAGKDLPRHKISLLRKSIVRSLSRAVDLLDGLVEQGRGLTESYEGLVTLQVPRKIGDPCSSCGRAIQRVRIRGRSTYFCVACQPRMN